MQEKCTDFLDDPILYYLQVHYNDTQHSEIPNNKQYNVSSINRAGLMSEAFPATPPCIY